MKKTKTQDNLQAKYLRVLADYQNLEKRTASDRLSLIKYTNAQLLSKILPIIDDLERAQVHLKDVGLSQIISQFVKLLDAEGVKPLDPVGSPFDPNSMDCVELVDGQKDVVISTQLKGYSYQNRILRPARVSVGNGTIGHKTSPK